jgi:3-dehydroquinate synthase
VGINLTAGKNLVGAFYQPRLVLCDLDTLATLPLREYRAGLAEVIKYGVIFDRSLFELLERKLDKLLLRDPVNLADVVQRCCQIKATVVGRDELDQGLRAILNFGHTIGHALEAVSGYGKYLHGEAISLGQVGAAWLSNRIQSLPDKEFQRIRALLQRGGLPTRIRITDAQCRKLLDAMTLDKKVTAGKIRFVLARRIGQVEFGHAVTRPMIAKALRALSVPDGASSRTTQKSPTTRLLCLP